MAKYDKYIDIEFCYNDPNRKEPVYMTYTGTDKGKGFTCCKCDKKLYGKVSHLFTGSQYGEEWVFGSDCVKYVFGAGIGTGEGEK